MRLRAETALEEVEAIWEAVREGRKPESTVIKATGPKLAEAVSAAQKDAYFRELDDEDREQSKQPRAGPVHRGALTQVCRVRVHVRRWKTY